MGTELYEESQLLSAAASRCSAAAVCEVMQAYCMRMPGEEHTFIFSGMCMLGKKSTCAYALAWVRTLCVGALICTQGLGACLWYRTCPISH